MRHDSNRSRISNRGFTFVEMMIVLTISSFIAIGLYQFTITSSRGFFSAEEKMKLNSSLRQSQQEFNKDTLAASYVVLYEDFEGSYRELTPTELEKQGRDFRLERGKAGNFMLLIFNGEDTDPFDNVAAPVEKIVGYYLDTQGTNKNRMMRFEKALTNVYVGDSLELTIPETTDAINHDIVYEKAHGLIENSSFYKFREDTIMMSALVVSGNKVKEIKNAVNLSFTVNGG